MKAQLRAGAELDLLTQDELREVLSDFAESFQNRPLRRLRVPAGVALDGSGNGDVRPYRVETGYRLVLTRIEISLDGYTAAAPYNPSAQGGVDVYVDDHWRDGIPIGGNTGYILPTVYTQGDDTAIVADQDALLKIRITGGPVSTGAIVNVCGFLVPIPNVK